MTGEKSPPKYAEWHKIGLKLLLSGDKPTAQGLIDGRGGGSMTTATAALNEFYADYLPSVLSAATLGAPAEISDLVGDLWTRLAEYARGAAAKTFDAERGQLQDQVQRLEGELARAGVAHQTQAQELDSAKAATAKQEARAIGAEGELAEQRRIVEDLNRALSQAHRDLDRQAGELAQARTMAADRKAELATLREDHRIALAGVRGQHRDELARLRESHDAALKALGDRAAAAVDEHARALQAQETAHQALRAEQAAALEAAGEREQVLRSKLVEASSALAVAQEQLAQAARLEVEHQAERDRLTGLIEGLQATVQSLSSRKDKTPQRTKRAGKPPA